MSITINKIISKLNRSRFLTHFLTWILFSLFFLLSFSGIQPFKKSIILVLSILGFSIPAVYLHFFLVEELLRKKKYLLYSASILGILLLYGRFINYVVRYWIFPDEEGTYVVGEFILAVFLLMSSGLHYFITGLQARKQLVEIESQKTKAELESLKMQLNPHFLFNSLNNIYGLMDDESAPAKSLLKLSSLLRYMLDSSKQSKVDLKNEIQFIEDYIALEQLRLDNCKVNYSKSGSVEGLKISPFLMIPFVENAFKHGRLNAPDSYINISIKIESREVEFCIENLKRKNAIIGHQIGIDNVRKRLHLLDEEHILEVADENDTFKIRLKMKL